MFLANPFVYGRLLYGQWLVLAAYAALPWVALSARRFLAKPTARGATLTAIAITVDSVLSLHFFLLAAVLVAALSLATLLALWRDSRALFRLVVALLLMAVATLALNAYWIAPILLGTGSEGVRIAAISPADFAAYAVVPDDRLGLLPNVLGLYGFWAEATGRFTSMKAFVPIWPDVLLAVLILAAIGALVGIWRQSGRERSWAIGLLLAAVVGVALEIGVSSRVTEAVVTWLEAAFPPYRGMRDSGKWAALLALAYSQLSAGGATYVISRARERIASAQHREWIASGLAALAIAIPLYYGNGLLFGTHGEISPSTYPASWYAADRTLRADSNPGRTVFLPWHEYMSYSFVHNQNSVVAPPAPGFFGVPIVVSLDPEVPGITPPSTPDQEAVSGLVSLGPEGRWAEVLASREIKYVLLAHELDWKSYEFLDAQPNLVKIGDWGSMVLYRNLLVS